MAETSLEQSNLKKFCKDRILLFLPCNLSEVGSAIILLHSCKRNKDLKTVFIKKLIRYSSKKLDSHTFMSKL